MHLYSNFAWQTYFIIIDENIHETAITKIDETTPVSCRRKLDLITCGTTKNLNYHK